MFGLSPIELMILGGVVVAVVAFLLFGAWRA